MKKEDCLFCKIVAGEIPSFKIFEDDQSLAFLDISGDVEGHTLVVPKEHFESALDCPQDLFCKLMATAQKIAKHFVENCGFDGVNFAINAGKSAQQEIPHLHIHVIPRKKTDNFSIYATLATVERDLATLQQKLKME